MTALFPRVRRLRRGYASDQVDRFFDRARQAYEAADPVTMTSSQIRAEAFDLVRRGYDTVAVDNAMDRLEAAFVALDRAEFIRSHGQQAWMDRLATQASTLYERLNRPEGQRFAPPGRGEHGYDPAPVDAMCARLTAYFDHGAPLTSHELRSATFRRRGGSDAYAEGPVDAFFARAVEVLLGVE